MTHQLSTRGITPAGGGWTVADIETDDTWRFRVEPGAADVAIAAARATADAPLLELDAGDLPLGDLEPIAEGIAQQLTPGRGRGLALLQGLPIDGLTEAEIERLYWAVGLRVGEPVSQNLAGEFLCHVRTQAGIPHRGFASTGKLDFHCDMTEIAALLAVQVARSGGASAFASLATVHDVLLDERPDLLGELYRPFYFSRLAEQHPWERPFTVQPIFARDETTWGGFVNPGLIRHALTIAGVPPHTPQQAEALDALLAIANRPEHRLQVQLGRGDAAFFHNSVVLHARTDFEDSDDPTEKRHLLRLWLDVPNSARRVPWPVVYDFRYGNSGLTRRGVVAGEQQVRPLVRDQA